MSHDMEDIIAVIDGRPEIAHEVQNAETGLRQYLSKRFEELLANKNFRYALPGHVQGGTDSPSRTPIVLRRVEALIIRT